MDAALLVSTSGGSDGRGEEAGEYLDQTVVALLGGLEQTLGGSVGELVDGAAYALLDQRAEIVRDAAGRVVDLALGVGLHVGAEP